MPSSQTTCDRRFATRSQVRPRRWTVEVRSGINSPPGPIAPGGLTTGEDNDDRTTARRPFGGGKDPGHGIAVGRPLSSGGRLGIAILARRHTGATSGRHCARHGAIHGLGKCQTGNPRPVAVKVRILSAASRDLLQGRAFYESWIAARIPPGFDNGSGDRRVSPRCPTSAASHCNLISALTPAPASRSRRRESGAAMRGHGSGRRPAPGTGRLRPGARPRHPCRRPACLSRAASLPLNETADNQHQIADNGPKSAVPRSPTAAPPSPRQGPDPWPNFSTPA